MRLTQSRCPTRIWIVVLLKQTIMSLTQPSRLPK